MPPAPYHVVLIETSGNQGFIFQSNKLRENVGASELVHRVGSKWALDAVARHGGPDLRAGCPAQIRDKLLGQRSAGGIASAQVEVLVATSSKALLMVRDEARATAIVRDVTMAALRDAPGLDVCGVVGRPLDLEREPLHVAVAEVHEMHPAARTSRPGSVERFLRLPPVASCVTSALPASGFDDEAPPEERDRPRSVASLRKRAVARAASQRFAALAASGTEGVRRLLARDIGELEREIDGLDWIAVVHADGNGIGAVLGGLHESLGFVEPRHAADYADALRRFSCELDGCGERALLEAIGVLGEVGKRAKKILPIVPLVVGGDDLTVLVEGRSALRFAVAYLRAFERETGNEGANAPLIADLAQRRFGCARLGASAGVAIVKPHFPFSVAYDLAAELADSAKQVKTRVVHDGRPLPCTALDFHAHYDSAGGDLDEIRARLRSDDGQAILTAKPYVVSDPARLGHSAASPWVRLRTWEEVARRARSIGRRNDDGSAVLPGTQRQALREAVFEGVVAGNRRLGILSSRYDLKGIAERLGGEDESSSELDAEGSEGSLGPSIFVPNPDAGLDGASWVTRYLDALEILEFDASPSRTTKAEEPGGRAAT